MVDYQAGLWFLQEENRTFSEAKLIHTWHNKGGWMGKPVLKAWYAFHWSKVTETKACCHTHPLVQEWSHTARTAPWRKDKPSLPQETSPLFQSKISCKGASLENWFQDPMHRLKSTDAQVIDWQPCSMCKRNVCLPICFRSPLEY